MSALEVCYGSDGRRDSRTLTSENAEGLALDFKFDLIPDCPAATAAGYTPATRAKAMAWSSPLIEGDRFYYSAWFGPTLGTHLSSILVCRKRDTGSLVWAVNCADYNLDTAPNLLGDKSVIVRNDLAVLGDTLYGTNVVLSNVGPQLYAINKNTGSLKWACAYYTPGSLGFLTLKGDYSAYAGSNERTSALSPLVFTKSGRRYIAVGSSSLQASFNFGQLLTGYPVYRDQGVLALIEDQGPRPRLVWLNATSAPPLKVGDTLARGGDPQYDPFIPGQDFVVGISQSTPTNYLVNPFYDPAPPAPGIPGTCGIASYVIFDSTTVISPAMVQPIWSTPGLLIYQDQDNSVAYTLDQLLALWQQEQQAANAAQDFPMIKEFPQEVREKETLWCREVLTHLKGAAAGATVKHTIAAWVPPAVLEGAAGVPGNWALVYAKKFFPGDVIAHDFDAQSLSDYGISTWSAPPILTGKNGNLIVVTTGQSHNSNLSNYIYYAQPLHNFLALKTPVVDAEYAYMFGQATLKQVKDAKAAFCSKIRAEALDVMAKSPRSRLSYADALLGFYVNDFVSRGVPVAGGSLAFGVRSVAFDDYSFLTTLGTSLYNLKSLDGDLSPGPHEFKTPGATRIASVGKHGLMIVINITDIKDHVKFNHQNLEAKGVTLERLVLAGPGSSGGGCNYLCSASGTSLVSCQFNASLVGATAFSSAGYPEIQVTSDGQVYGLNNSFVQSIDVASGVSDWETPLGNRANTQNRSSCDLVFTVDTSGSLYAISARDGAIVWKYNGASVGMNGGIVAPAVADDGQVIFVNNYSVYGFVGSAGPSGAAFRVDPGVMVTRCSTLGSTVVGKSYTSWDMVPKTDDILHPVNRVVIKHAWTSGLVKATHTTSAGVISSFELGVASFDAKHKKILFQPSATLPPGLEYVEVELINEQVYRLDYIDSGLASSAWLSVDSQSPDPEASE